MYQLNLTLDELTTLRTTVTHHIKELTNLMKDNENAECFKPRLEKLEVIRKNIITLSLIALADYDEDEKE